MATSAALVHSSAARAVTTGQSPLQQLQSDLITRASRNDYAAALELGMGYTCGHFGLTVNYDEARKYLRIAALGAKEAGKNSQHWEIGQCAQSFATQYKTKLTETFVQEIFGGRVPKHIDNYDFGYNTTIEYIPARYLYAFNWFEVEKNAEKPELDQSELQDVLNDVQLCVANSFMPALALSGLLHCKNIIGSTDGVPNVEQGLTLLNRAANEGGDAVAKMYLAEMYTGKHGVGKNLNEAKKWAEAAEEQKAPGADALLRKINKERQRGKCTIL